MTTKLLTVKKDSPNKGRKFYKCPKPQGKRCDFFQWYDEDIIADNPSLFADSGVTCECGTPVKLLTVKRESPNKGRQFYKCAKSQQCEFFQWADEDTTTSVERFSHMDQNMSFNYDNQEVYCPCGLLAKPLVVKKDSPNKGRKYYTCPNHKATECGFFQWADGDQFNTEQSSQRIVCRCKIYAKFLTVKKEGPNKGREFYTCPRSQGYRCDFFQWADEVNEN